MNVEQTGLTAFLLRKRTGTQSTRLKEPRAEKLREHRKGIKAIHRDKELKPARKADYRNYRTIMKRLMRAEKYDLLRKHQHTGGWITW
ncbi:hypothetical protein [Paenibacillus sp. NPDC057967]|uniref:hypothetical protein n=1 Tax=Paenibacillus sp. NPDC057967 TaxID=3346293 RepID=UPI0036DBCAD3